MWGICTLLIVGYLEIAISPESPWHEYLAVLFGIGTGLTLDEFALWLNLKDVYWSEQGRRSIDAVIVMAAFAGDHADRLQGVAGRGEGGRGRDRRASPAPSGS